MPDFMLNDSRLREVLIFFFHSEKTAAEAHQELHKVYGDAAISETMFRDWFCRIKDCDFDVDDSQREGRPNTFEDDEDPCQTPQELSAVLGVTRQEIACIGNVSKARNLDSL
ncbi:putative homeodomain leucine-zipper encoding, Homez [Trypoxylus dichotomus]